MSDDPEHMYEYLEDMYQLATPMPLDFQTNPLNKEKWFHGRISRETAEQLLCETRQFDCFLVREGINSPGTYSISLKKNGEVKHFLIRRQPSGTYEVAGGKRQFDGLKSLVGFYEKHPLTSAGELLTTPLVWTHTEGETRDVSVVFSWAVAISIHLPAVAVHC